MAFLPSDISGLTLWLKSDTEAYKDAGTTLAVNNDTIQQWNDQSGNSNTASQSTAASRPTLLTNRLNGLPTLYFNGNYLDVANPNNFDLSPFSIFIVGNALGTTGTFTGKDTTGVGNSDNRRRKLHVVNDGTDFGYISGPDPGTDKITATCTVLNYNVLSVIGTSNSNHDLLVQQVDTNSTTAMFDTSFNTGFAGNDLNIGAAFSNGAEPLNGEIAEVIIYNSALSIADYINVINYLVNRYALPQIVTQFTASGSWVCPAGVTSVLVECIGGGGAGGGATSNSNGGGGGAGGQYAKKQVSVTPGTSYTITVGGVQAGTTGSGTAGNDTSFGSATVVAKGGPGGTANNGAGGTGSTTSGVGDVVNAGGSGSAGSGSTRSGGGGGAAGILGAGGSTTASITGGTGTNINGGAGGLGLAATSANGGAGNNYGGGGAGAYRTTTTSRSGGQGAQGILTITYPQPLILNKFISEAQNSPGINVIQAANRASNY